MMGKVITIALFFTSLSGGISQPSREWGALFLFQAPSAFIVYPTTFPKVAVSEESSSNTRTAVALLTPLIWYGSVWVMGKTTKAITLPMAVLSGAGGIMGGIHGAMLNAGTEGKFFLSLAENIGNYYLAYFGHLKLQHAVRWIVWNSIGAGVGLGIDAMTENIRLIVMDSPEKPQAPLTALGAMIGGYISLLLPVEDFTCGDIWMEGTFGTNFGYLFMTLNPVKNNTIAWTLFSLTHVAGAGIGYYLGKKRDIGFLEALGITIGLGSAVHLAVFGIAELEDKEISRGTFATSALLTNIVVAGGYYLFSTAQSSSTPTTETSWFDNFYFNPLSLWASKFLKDSELSVPIVYAKFNF